MAGVGSLPVGLQFLEVLEINQLLLFRHPFEHLQQPFFVPLFSHGLDR
jgi:hypothetical protein